jgi:Tfp pilus assembly protein PilF
MRAAILFAICGLAFAQAPDPAYEPLSHAYDALKTRDYDAAISWFVFASEAAPGRASIRKDLAYTYLKIGENILARDQFAAAAAADPADTQVAMEYAYLCYETKERREARRVFDRLRRSGNQAAEQAFQNIDAPLASGIERWKKAIEMGADNFSAHFELANLAEERDELPLAAEHFEKAWRFLTERRSVLVRLARVWKDMGRFVDADSAFLAASRSSETRAAEEARELLPSRYPWVYEFRSALDLDPGNTGLRRELGFLLLKMGFDAEGEVEFEALVRMAPDDLLAATQLAFLLRARGAAEQAQPLFDRVLAGSDDELANRVRAVLRIAQIPAAEPKPAAVAAKEMAERSFKAGYMKDAASYLLEANRADPGDYGVMLKLGWTFNMLRQDSDAVRWFDQARRSPDPSIASEARSAYRTLRRQWSRFRYSGWSFPTYSSRWRDVFAYGQVRTEIRTKLPVRPYVSLRFVGDTRSRNGGLKPLIYSESSVIPAVGLRTQAWHGATAWAEAGSAAGYLSGRMLPDYRVGIALARSFGTVSPAESPGWFADTAMDGLFASRFGKDTLFIQQGRAGYGSALGSAAVQLYWNGNLTLDRKREDWANFWETGPGVRISGKFMPRSAYFTLNVLSGRYLVGARQRYSDVRAGIWYAFTY